jgi:dTDP-4-amino-4,6-dideoxygalactose transaminase
MKFLDLGLSEPSLRRDLDAAYRRVMDSGWVILGPELQAFESEFADYCGAPYCAGVGNGLDAMVLALRAAGVGPGDEVIVPSHTFAATWVAVGSLGAIPKPAEVDPTTYTLDPAAVAAAMTSRTRAIMPVSLYGHPADMGQLMALAETHGLFVLEDAAQGHGSAFMGRRAGAVAHATAFSFYPTKNLGAIGDAGAVVSRDAAFDDRIRMLRNYGARHKYEHETIGYNSRLDELQAAFLRVQLKRLEPATESRRSAAAAYDAGLAQTSVLAPVEATWARHVYHLYVVRSARRDALKSHLNAQGIETLIHYPRACHLQPAFADLGYGEGAFPIAEQLAREVLSLPLRPGMQNADLERVVASVADFA